MKRSGGFDCALEQVVALHYSFSCDLPVVCWRPGRRELRIATRAADAEHAMNSAELSFHQRLQPVGRILELDGWFVWCCSAIDGPDGKVHLFCSRWPAELGMAGWSTDSEIVHAVSDRPEGPFELRDVALRGRGGEIWDAQMVHNPTIHKVGVQYALIHIGNRDGRPFTQCIGLALSNWLDGPWRRFDQPILRPSQRRAWDWLHVTNPALLQHPNGQFWLYYKSWDIRDNLFKMGLAIADRIEGPYEKHPANPVVDYSALGKRMEDPYVFMQNGVFHMIMADDNQGIVKQHGGIIVESRDGIRWAEPKLAYDTTDIYFGGKVERFERPQVLMRDGRPAYLYLAATGGRCGTSSPVCLRVRG